MANTIRIKRRASGGSSGAPTSLENAELAFTEVDDVLYYGKGTGGAGGSATSVIAIGGSGAFATLGTNQTISGNKTFSGTVTVATPTSNMHAATKKYVDDSVSAVTGSITVAGDSGSSQTISLNDTLTISGGTGLSSVAGSTDTLTINLDNTAVSAGSYGSATAVSTFTVDGQGRLTAAGTANISIASSAITDFNEAAQDAVGNSVGTGLSYSDSTGAISVTANTYDAYGSASTVAGNLTTHTGATEAHGATGAVVGTTNSQTLTNKTLTSPIIDGSGIIFEGATANDHETTLAVTDPTADRTITLPNATGTVALTSDLPTSMSINIYGDSGVTSLATTTAGSGSFTISGGTGLTASASSSTITVNLDNTTVNPGSYGSSTAVAAFTVDAQGRLTAASATNIRVATTGETGIASFASGDFAVTAGEVTIKSGGVDNAQLANSTITLGSSTLTLGSTTTSVAGITELTVDNMNFNGNEISTTDTNGNLSLNPAGTGSITVNGHKITNLGTPVDDADAATKGYVDNKVTGLSWKQAVHTLASGNVPLTGSTPLEVDSHTLLDGDRVLLIGQTTATQKGIYDVAISGGSYTLTRSLDANVYTELHGLAVFVQQGTSYANTGWVQTTDNLTDFSGQAWAQFSGAGAYGAGSGLSLDGTTFNINVDANGGIEISGDALLLKSTVAGAGLTLSSGVLAVGGTSDKITVNSDSIDIASTYIGQSSITTLGTIATGTWNATAIAIAKGGTGSTTASDARTALGLAIGTNVQAYSPNLGAIAGLTSAANALPYFTGSGTAAVTTLSSFIRDLLDDADAATARTTLGVDTYTIDGGTF
jgi:hypothetical protein